MNILFVCLGNICRSPLAEGIFRDLVSKNSLNDKISCDSAGTAGYHIGQLPDHRAIEVAAEHGIRLTHKGRKLSTADFDVFDHIIVMDEELFKDVHNLYYQTKHVPPPAEKLFLLGDYQPNRKSNEVVEISDPYYGDKQDFEKVYKQILLCSETYLKHLIDEKGL